MTELNLAPFIDRIAQARFEAYDSHFHDGSFTWEKYKAEEPSDTEALYLQEARRDVEFAMPALVDVLSGLALDAVREELGDRNRDIAEDDREFVKIMQRDLVPKIDDSAFVASLVPHPESLDVKFAVELGVSIMLDKPLLAITMPGSEPSEKLLRVADRIVEIPDLGSEEGQAILSAAITDFQQTVLEQDAAGEEPSLGTSDSPREDAPEGTHEGTPPPPPPDALVGLPDSMVEAYGLRDALPDDDDVDGPQ